MATDERELQLRERESRIEDLRKKLNTCGSNREYQALTEQIAADEQANSVLSDEILEGFDKIEIGEQKVAAEVAELEKAEAELAKTQKRVDSEKWNLESELERVERELAKSESALPEDFKQDYLRIAKVHGEDALATVEAETCQGCFKIITPQMYDQLRCGKPIFCLACGRLLYLPEPTSVAD
jgi:predicted  nucleic acid-binding Zn-ribbon protein